MPLLHTKSIDELIKHSEDPSCRLKKTLGPWSLTFLGIGAVIGSLKCSRTDPMIATSNTPSSSSPLVAPKKAVPSSKK